MCGIAGAVSFDNHKIDERLIPSLFNSIKHRGPDHNGSWISKNQSVLLLNTRLSILDLTKKGNQPFYSQNKRYIIVFNGEIYNFKDLKKDLKEFKFHSETDTEVLLNLYIKYKSKCLKMLEGMFSFAIYDNYKGELFCARDHFGIKPFYYYKFLNKFWFSSEIKSFFIVNKNIKKNEQSVYRYLNSEYHEHIQETYFKNIFKIKPGHYILVKNSKIKENKFWDFKDDYSKISLPKKYNDRKEYFKSLIDESVKKSMISDVPISLASSGGLDSSILQLTAKKFNPKVNMVSWIFKNKKFSEEKYINQIGKVTKLRREMFSVTPNDFKKNLNLMIKINEEPFSGLPIMAYYLCLKKTNNSKVILDGSGLDESHTGYDKYFNKKLKIDDNFNFGQDGSKSIFSNIVHENLVNKYHNFKENIDLPFNNILKNSKYLDMFYLKLPRALRFRDKLSMSISKEIRPCFLNKDLIASLFKIKAEEQFKNGFGKFLLRDTYKDDISNKISFSKKRNIQTPQSEWFKKDLDKWLTTFIKKSSIWDMNWIDKKKFDENYELFKRGKINNSFFIWKLINLDIWNKSL